MMLDHTAGVPALRDPVKPKGTLDWDYMIGRIEAEEPFFAPGTRTAYHALTFAWTVGGAVRHATGRALGEIFREEVAGPLGLDFRIGRDGGGGAGRRSALRAGAAAQDPRRRGARRGDAHRPYEPHSLPALAFLNRGGLNNNLPESHRAEIASAGGITNARGLAGLYRPLGARRRAAAPRDDRASIARFLGDAYGRASCRPARVSASA